MASWWRKPTPARCSPTRRRPIPNRSGRCAACTPDAGRCRRGIRWFRVDRRRRLLRQRQGAARRQLQHPARTDRRRGRRNRLGQIDPGAGHHRPAAADQRARSLSTGQAAAAGAQATATKDQLRRIQMIYQMPDTALNPRQPGARHHRAAAGASISACAAPTRDSADRRAAGDDRARRPLSRPPAVTSSPAARSSASASPARWPPSPSSSSATR